MPENNHNLIQIRQKYNADLAFVEGKINYNEFESRHQVGEKSEWFEINYVAYHSFFLHSLLLNLKVEDRIRAVLKLNGFSRRSAESAGGFGGSTISNLLNEEDRVFTESRAKIALFLDIPIIYLLKDKPTYNETMQYEYLEFQQYGRKISFDEMKRTLTRPQKRSIIAYHLELVDNDVNEANQIHELLRFCRVDLQKTYYSVEFYFNSSMHIDISFINTIIKMFDDRVYRVILSNPILRDSFKLSIIGVYIEEQHKDAKNFAEKLLKYDNGVLLFPYNFDFKIDNVVPN
ncbi:hypothetical protein [Sporosarcina highlanderae]|uniref:HTH cro/C1-type domain-containing protein n=1 Tax=Sporosarcina highlanderae TaxID=3035916 RepID=A0ABT8JS23_9BACL|nr:hypothetical protein [Sporosarcina highlanderae]MDN4607959.1 hypothetical protein [Sporosarcina highlanderae]